MCIAHKKFFFMLMIFNRRSAVKVQNLCKTMASERLKMWKTQIILSTIKR